jgi:F-type H+-transporting ATPase subunit gamma
MDPERLFAALLRQYLFVACFRAFAESAASEHASRVATLQGAERNLDERLQDLRRACQRRRQDAITAELLDIVSGFEAQCAPGDRQ